MGFLGAFGSRRPGGRLFVEQGLEDLGPPLVVGGAHLGDDFGVLVDHVGLLARVSGDVVELLVVYQAEALAADGAAAVLGLLRPARAPAATVGEQVAVRPRAVASDGASLLADRG